MVPIDNVKAVSPRLGINQSNQAKGVHCEALSQIANFCESVRAVPSPTLNKEKKILDKYSEKMDWVTDVLQSFGEYDYHILKELYRYSNDSRNDLESERQRLVHLIKIGVFDPNKNVFKLKPRIKKKRSD